MDKILSIFGLVKKSDTGKVYKEAKKERDIKNHNVYLMSNRIFWNIEDLKIIESRDPDNKSIKDRINELSSEGYLEKELFTDVKMKDIPALAQRDVIYVNQSSMIKLRNILKEEQKFLVANMDVIKQKDKRSTSTRFYDNIQYINALIESLDHLYEESRCQQEEDITSIINRWGTVAVTIMGVIGAGYILANEIKNNE